jgi:2-polyprenyl-6-methoxyphenol hydroxylase-like FAD-dependent oxidoreductase
MAQPFADIIIIGAGLAGASAATLLGAQGRRVLLIDTATVFSRCFKAEKIEPDQANLFRKFDLLEACLPWTGRISTILGAMNGRVFQRLPVEQYGIYYHDMVNAIRSKIPPAVDFKIGRVQEIAVGSDIQSVTLFGGETYTARLIVLSCGTGGNLHKGIGLEKQMIQKDQSLSFGFTVARTDREPFPFDSVTYHPDGIATRIAYLTLFRIGTQMRANLFTVWSPGEERTRRFIREPHPEIVSLLPKLTRVIGAFDVVSRVETGAINLYRVQKGHLQPGLVLLGDAFQNACPTTGTGLSKVLTDVDVLCYDCIPEWLSTPGMGLEKITRFYENPRKQQVDQHSLISARHLREVTTDRSFLWRLRRLRQRGERHLASLSSD